MTTKYTEEQALGAKRKRLKIYRDWILSDSSKIVIFDDESYFPLDSGDLCYRQYYYSAIPGDVTPFKRIQAKDDYFSKVMVWQRIDEMAIFQIHAFFGARLMVMYT